MAGVAPNGNIRLLRGVPVDMAHTKTYRPKSAADQFTAFSAYKKYTLTKQTYIRNIFGTLRNDSCINLDYGDAELGYQFFNKLEYHAWHCAFDDIFVCPKTIRIGGISFNYSFGNNVPFGSFYCLNKTYFG